MKITFFSTQPYDKLFFEKHNSDFGFELEFLEAQLNEQSTPLAKEADVVCAFVNDRLNETVIHQLAQQKIKLIALRCAGFNNVDLAAATRYTIKVVRVPAYSPYAVAEHAVALIMTLNRKTHKAYNRVRDQNFSLNGLLGFDLYGKTIGVVGTGNIGQVFCTIMSGFGCRIIAYDKKENESLKTIGVSYLPITDVFAQADVISLHCPLNEQTRHLINEQTIRVMKKGVMLINTSRGALIDTPAVIDGLKSGQIGALGIDVYEQEEKLFFLDLTGKIIDDDVIALLTSLPNVLITAHQGFFTHEALTQIAQTTLQNIKAFGDKQVLTNEVKS
ncbi:MAG: hydroxyacid dehydrogenase [Flavobacterium psychrophilum]|nr:MAG: hydroxyacid dehydrogenase [Flavobacterium psychrophilum]